MTLHSISQIEGIRASLPKELILISSFLPYLIGKDFDSVREFLGTSSACQSVAVHSIHSFNQASFSHFRKASKQDGDFIDFMDASEGLE